MTPHVDKLTSRLILHCSHLSKYISPFKAIYLGIDMHYFVVLMTSHMLILHNFGKL